MTTFSVTALDTSGYYALGVPAYLVLMGAEIHMLRRRGISSYSFPESLANMSAGLGEVTIGVIVGPWLVALYEFAYRNSCIAHPFRAGSVASWVFSILLADFCYYAYHRASHAVGLFWAIHGVHHQARVMNVSVALRHPWLSDAYSAPFYALCPLLGVPTAQFFVSIAVVSFYALTVHSRTFHRPGLVIFVTPKSHIVHHAKNPRYIDKNFGAMFTIWDRLFGTHVEVCPEDPPSLGTLSGCDTYDGARAQWIFFRDLRARAASVRGARAKVLSLFRAPAWRAEGSAERAVHAPPEVPRRRRACIAFGAGFFAVLSLAGFLFVRASALPFAARCALTAVVLSALHLLGRALDGKRVTP